MSGAAWYLGEVRSIAYWSTRELRWIELRSRSPLVQVRGDALLCSELTDNDGESFSVEVCYSVCMYRFGERYTTIRGKFRLLLKLRRLPNVERAFGSLSNNASCLDFTLDSRVCCQSSFC
jgi:hypothetical protein